MTSSPKHIHDFASMPEIKLLTPQKFADDRGFVSETYNKRGVSRDIADDFVQDIHSFSTLASTLRGLHFQAPPFDQGKLVRVIRGAIVDVAVDIRWGSPTYARHVTAILSRANWNQIYIPPGFAHGFLTLEPETEVIYKVTGYHSPAHERGILWNDPHLAIEWGVTADKVVLSDRDRQNPRLDQAAVVFRWKGG